MKSKVYVGDMPGILNMYVQKSFVVILMITIIIIIKKEKGSEGSWGKFCCGNRFYEKTKLRCSMSA